MLAGNPLAHDIGGGLATRPAERLDTRVDMTAMIDLVFMLNIFFLVTTLVNAMAEVDLPSARHVTAADLKQSTIFTVVANGLAPARIYVGDGETGNAIPANECEDAAASAVQAGLKEGKKSVVIKAESGVHLRDIAALSAAASVDPEIRLHLAVMEKDQ